MRPTYNAELARLRATYENARSVSLADMVELQASIAGQPAIFVASGGGFPVAQFAAERHTAVHGELASAVSPLVLVGEATVHRVAVIAISARAAHPDVGFALLAARTRHNYPTALVTHRDVADLSPALVRRLTHVVTVPNNGRDGFLATNSVLALATVFLRGAQPDLPLPPDLPNFDTAFQPIRHPRTLILYGAGQRSAAIDLDTRLSELGLSSCQTVDYRNFAHGRHTGLSRHLESTTVVAFSTAASSSLARATLSLLPDDLDVIEIHSALDEPVAALDLLAGSMRLLGATAGHQGLDPAKPQVPQYGRRLYHLGAQRHMKLEQHGPVERKLAEVGAPASPLLRNRYSHAFDEWKTAMKNARFSGVVLDYDGTVCSTRHRFELPDDEVQAQIVRILESGACVGFASGRGRSLYTDLRKWIPAEHWRRIPVGVYNGGNILSLDDEWTEVGSPVGPLSSLLERLANEPLSELTKVDARAGQLSLEPVRNAGIGIGAVAKWLDDCMARAPALNLKLLKSGHSVDVVEPSVSKTRVLEAVANCCGGAVLAVGDRGEAGGNDYELLAAATTSVSVDRCSADPTRCWNVARPGQSGPDALVYYLRRLTPTSSGLRFSFPATS